MPPELADYILKYGYLIIFALVFLQEIGVPNPVPNELVLLFSGYLASTGQLSIFSVLLTVMAADFIGTTILYIVFYFLGEKILAMNLKWLPKEKINKIMGRISEKGRWGIFLGRLIPYLRGYTSVAAGLLRIKPKFFLPTVFGTALLWSGGYAFAGKLLGSKWESVAQTFGAGKIALIGAGVLICVLFIPKINNRLFNKKI